MHYKDVPRKLVLHLLEREKSNSISKISTKGNVKYLNNFSRP